MTETSLRTHVAVSWFLIHFGIVVLVIVLFLLGGFSFDEMTTLLGFVVPMFLGITTMISRRIIKDRHRTSRKSRPEHPLYVFVTLFLVILFSSSLVAVLLLKAYNIGFKKFDDLKILVGILESIFVVFIAQFVQPLFATKVSPAAKDPALPSDPGDENVIQNRSDQ